MKSEVAQLSFKDLINYTSNFSKENYLGYFQFGKVYRGKFKGSTSFTEHVVVKIWEPCERYYYYYENELRLVDEVMLLQHYKFMGHHGIMKLYGYCYEGEQSIGVVYKFNPLDTLFNLLPSDGFTWLQRIKVALRLADILKHFHSGDTILKGHILRNLDAAHIMVDEEYNPKVYDFAMVTGGIFPDRRLYRVQHLVGSIGYAEPGYIKGLRWSNKSDVFAFGIILLELIAKRVYTIEDEDAARLKIDFWAEREYLITIAEGGLSKRILVHHSLAAEPVFCRADGRKITKLAMRCIAERVWKRPSIKQVINQLLKLQVVAHHASFLGVAPLLHARAEKKKRKLLSRQLRKNSFTWA